LRCDDATIPCDASNLVVKAASALQEQVAASSPAVERRAIGGLSAALQKRIPVGAGLGGGSSDGAATLAALNRLWGAGRTPQQLSDLAARFGSDLSFFFHGPSSVCTGRGEVVRPIARPRPRWAVLILPGIHMATPAVYRRYDEMNLGRTDAVVDDVDWAAWAALDARGLLPRLVNDLEAPAFALSAPLAELHRRAGERLGRIVRMSGSGSTLFTLYDDTEEAAVAAARISEGLGVRAEVVAVCPDVADTPFG
jgi:4-diphosphocytidyl-2-C-methyl-D-erythritol kinase